MNEILRKYKGKKVKMFLFDGYVKVGLLESYDDIQYYMRFHNGDRIAISKRAVRQITVLNQSVDFIPSKGGKA